MAVIDDLHLVELLQLHVVAFGVEDKNAVVGLDPSLCHQADEVAFSRRGGSSNQNPALASRYAGRGCVIECSDVDPPTCWAPTLCPSEIRTGQQLGDTGAVRFVKDDIGISPN